MPVPASRAVTARRPITVKPAAQPAPTKLLAFDCETTGVDFGHGARPFFVTFCTEGGEQTYYEWDVDPLTRAPRIPPADLAQVATTLSDPANYLVGQNLKFDVRALGSLLPDLQANWAWGRTHDTLIAAHLLASNQPKDLTSLCVRWLGVNIEPYEKRLEEAVQACRRLCRQRAFKERHGEWAIADDERPDMPSAKGTSTWRFDYWLPRAMVKTLWETSDAGKTWASADYKLQQFARHQDGWEYRPPGTDREHLADQGHPWWTVLGEYANADSEATLLVWKRVWAEVRKRGLEKLYGVRMETYRVTAEMERRRVTVKAANLEELRAEFREAQAETHDRCIGLAASLGYDLELPKGAGPNQSLRRFMFDVLDVDRVYSKKSKTAEPTLDKTAMEHYSLTLAPTGKAGSFVRNLLAWRKRTTALGFLNSYAKFWVPLEVSDGNAQDDPGTVSDQGEQERPGPSGTSNQVLDVDGSSGQGRVRPGLRGGGKTSTQGGVGVPQRTDPKRSADTPQVRRPAVLQPGTPVSRNTGRQLEGHGEEESTGQRGQKRVSSTSNQPTTGRDTPAGKKSSTGSEGRTGGPGQNDGKISKKIEGDVRNGPVDPKAAGGKVRTGTVDGGGNSQQKNLETRRVVPGIYVLAPSFNLCGTDTLRFSCSNPNAQNISKQESKCRACDGDGEMGHGVCPKCRGSGKDMRSVRYCFGPAPGREWWSMDAKNIELRIPFYASGEQSLIDLFERPDDPPFYGSNHILNFSVVYPEVWADAIKKVGLDKAGPYCKKEYASSWYLWAKNGGFAIQYQAGERTADAAFHRAGAWRQLKSRFARLEAYNQECLKQAARFGYVTTIPDREVDPDHGYPLLCTRSDSGGILPTVPLSYRIQGTAMQWTAKAMNRCGRQLDQWRRTDGWDGFMTMQVHDELVFDLPAASSPVEDPKRSNLPRVKVLKRLMEQGGTDIGIPTPVGCEWHPDNWGEGISVKA